MGIPLNSVLGLTKDEIANSKIEFNMTKGKGGPSQLDVWLAYSDESKRNGRCEECSYWGWYGNQHNFRPGQWVFSMVRMARDDE